jgi:hypothetical protein
MTVSIGIESPDLDKQIMLLQHYPEIATRHFKPALKQCVAILDGAIRPAIPVETGEAKGKFSTSVTGTTISSLKGRAGWSKSNYPWYINVVEYGARPHEMGGGGKSKGAFAFLSRGYNAGGRSNPGQRVKVKGQWKTIRSHPGFKEYAFLRNGFNTAKPAIDLILAVANDKTIQDLAVA